MPRYRPCLSPLREGLYKLARRIMMDKEDAIVIFKEKEIRRIWHDNEWWFSVIDICAALTASVDSGAYWRKLKQRLIKEGSEVVTICHGLKLQSTELMNGKSAALITITTMLF